MVSIQAYAGAVLPCLSREPHLPSALVCSAAVGLKDLAV